MTKKKVPISSEKQTDPEKQTVANSVKWRNLVAFWILGLCNNYGYVIMLAAAADILDSDGDDDSSLQTNSTNHPDNGTINIKIRSCNDISTGAILLADILPCLVIKLMSPFLPFYVNVRMFICIVFSAVSFVMVSQSSTEWLILIGVIITSISSGLGEATLLSYSQRFSKDVISTWSSGTGGAGVIGALSYAVLKSWLSVEDTLLIMLVIPVLEAVTFWLILVQPSRASQSEKLNTDSQLQMIDPPKKTVKEKIKLVPSVLKYMVPLGLVYFFEYFINQGLCELIEFDGNNWKPKELYRWLMADYQIGVFISRSSVNLLQINHLWMMSVFQFINVVIILCETLFYFIPSVWIIFVIVLWEGMLGGAAYVNTLYKMSKEIRWEDRESSLGIVTMADSFGIALAGWAAMPVHNAICKLPKPERLTF